MQRMLCSGGSKCCSCETHECPRAARQMLLVKTQKATDLGVSLKYGLNCLALCGQIFAWMLMPSGCPSCSPWALRTGCGLTALPVLGKCGVGLLRSNSSA